MTLVYSEYIPDDKGTLDRHQAAMQTWRKSGMRLLPFVSDQNSRQIGDPHGLPFVKDMIEYGFQDGENIVAISNNDIRFSHDAKIEIEKSCESHGCFWTQRLDDNGLPDGGCDTFAVTDFWWHLNCHVFPDFFLGGRGWDAVLKELMVTSGCPEGAHVCFHTPHQNDHRQRLQTPAARWNEHLLNEWNKQKAVAA